MGLDEQVHFMMTKREKAKLDKIAKSTGYTVSKLIRYSIRRTWLDRYDVDESGVVVNQTKQSK